MLPPLIGELCNGALGECDSNDVGGMTFFERADQQTTVSTVDKVDCVTLFCFDLFLTNLYAMLRQ